jgi:hypothetical protein
LEVQARRFFKSKEILLGKEKNEERDAVEGVGEDAGLTSRL